VEKIKQANAKNSSQITVGEVLLIPEKYTVKSGDTLYLISRRFGVPLWELRNLNNQYSDEIRVGQVLYIPQKSPYQTMTVKKGDTLYLISKAYGVDIANLKKINGLIGDEIYPGMRLLIPQKSTASSVGSSHNYSPLASRSGVDRSIDRSTLSRAGSGIAYSAEDRMLLAKLIHAEAEGEPYIGKLAVGAVVVNRVKSSAFPNTIKGVIYQIDELGLYQFTPVEDGRLFYMTPSQESYKAADNALAGEDPTGGALFFFNPAKITNKWLLSKPVIYRVGQHVFTK
jgi:N-acetylmuramoyl-L-alanine amidase